MVPEKLPTNPTIFSPSYQTKDRDSIAIVEEEAANSEAMGVSDRSDPIKSSIPKQV